MTRHRQPQQPKRSLSSWLALGSPAPSSSGPSQQFAIPLKLPRLLRPQNGLSALVLAGLLAIHAAARAQAVDEDDLALSYGDNAFISIATGSRQPVSRAPAVATVITAQDIAAMGARDLDQVLESVPGLHVARETQGFAPVYVIRGIHLGFNPQVLVLINGVPINTVYTGNRGGAWRALPVNYIDRIEVIRGPGSALYGADAFSGVINIIYKSHDDVVPGTQVGASLGSFAARDAWLSHAGKLGGFDLSGYLRLGSTDGQRRQVDADAQTGWDQLIGSAASFAPGPINLGQEDVEAMLELSQQAWRWRAGYRLRDRLQLGTGVASALDPTGYGSGETVTTDLSYDNPQWREHWELSVQGSLFHYKELSRLTLFPAGAFGGQFADGVIGNPDKWERHARLLASAVYTGLIQHRVRLGVGLAREEVYRTRETKNFRFAPGPVLTALGTGSRSDVVDVSASAPFMTPHGRSNRYAFVQDEWNFLPDWTLTAGLRHDHYSDFGGTTNPRLALVWDAAYNLTAKLLYGRAFRAPSLSELYAINNPVVQGNANLIPERIETLEAALSWQPGPGVRLGVNVFHYEMRDIIRLVNTVYENVGRQCGDGLEVEANWDISRAWRLSGNYSYQRSVDALSGTLAAQSPAHHVYVRGDWRMVPGWSLHPQLNWVSERPRGPRDTRAPLAGYTSVDLTLQGQPAPRWQLALSVRNLLDEDIREPTPDDASPTQPFISLPKDFPMPGRSVTLQATYQF